MASIPVGFTQLAYLFDQPVVGKQALCTIGVEDPSGGWTSVQLDAAWAAWVDNFLPRQGARWKLVKLTAYQGAVGGTVASEKTGSVAGSIVQGATAPPQVAALVRKHTNAAGRSQRGRMFIPGVTDSQLEDDGLFAAGEFASWTTAASGYLTDMLAGGLTPFLLHGPPAAGGSAPAPTQITSLTVDQKCATQRRRLR